MLVFNAVILSRGFGAATTPRERSFRVLNLLALGGAWPSPAPRIPPARGHGLLTHSLAFLPLPKLHRYP